MTDRIEEAQERIRVLDYRLNRPHSEFVDKEGAKALLEDAKFLSAEVQRLRGELTEARKRTKEAEGDMVMQTVRRDQAESSLASLRASHQEVIRVVREWQEARKAVMKPTSMPWGKQRHQEAARFASASDALAALDLGGAE